ncbi:MAG: hypothetical protein IJ851_05800 [Eubacterium sp.]|nr:hypothetical protein [Eubacterium sp.]
MNIIVCDDDKYTLEQVQTLIEKFKTEKHYRITEKSKGDPQVTFAFIF